MAATNVIDFGRYQRPTPPDHLLDIESVVEGIGFEPSKELADWFRAVFIDEGGPLYNPEHEHLQIANIGALWTNVTNRKNGKVIVGQAERGQPMAMGKWAKARAEQQVIQWFGEIPDFIMTMDAGYASVCSDVEWCALVEHELMHMAQEHDEFGAPKFTNTGRPKFTIRGHDCEEFVGIVRRYGAVTPELQAMKDALNARPLVPSAGIHAACGTCLGRSAA